MYQTGTKIYQKDGSSFFSWNRRVSTTSSKASLSELKNSNKNGLGIKTIQVIDSSMRTKLIGSYVPMWILIFEFIVNISFFISSIFSKLPIKNTWS